MPLTVNGKIDTEALLALESDCISEEHIEPSNDVERAVLDIWKKGLKRESISVDADFFELGGNSLIAVSVINKINTILCCDLPLQIVFSSPTIKKLAQVINKKENDLASRLVPFQSKGKNSPIYCWPGLGGYCMNLRLLAEKMGTDRAFFGVQAYGINTGEIPYETISEMAAKDVAMIKQNQGDGSQPLKIAPHQTLVITGGSQPDQVYGGNIGSKQCRPHHHPTQSPASQEVSFTGHFFQSDREDANEQNAHQVHNNDYQIKIIYTHIPDQSLKYTCSISAQPSYPSRGICMGSHTFSHSMFRGCLSSLAISASKLSPVYS